MQSLSQQAGRSAIWQVAGGGWQTIVRLGASVILARTLTPADYGVFGMALLMREFIQQLGSWGMGVGVIAKKDATEEDLCTCFWSMAIIRFILFVLAMMLAPLGAWFFDDPRVTNVVRVISFTFLISMVSSVSYTLLSKELKFRAINIIQGVLAVVESGLAITLALQTDLGYWVLVIAMLVHSFLFNISVFLVARWWPKFRFSRESFQYLFRYGINGLGFNITNYLKQNLDYLLVGRLLGTASLGLYEFAYRIPHMVQDRISRPVGAVVFPALSKVQDDDEKLAQGYVQTVKYVSLISFPLLFGLAAVADVAVPVLWGEQWLPVIIPLRLLCLCAALRIAGQPLGAIYNCKNRPDLLFKISIVTLIWTILVVGYLGYQYGIIGVVSGMILSVFPTYVSLFIAFRFINEKVSTLLSALAPSFICSIFCAVMAYFSILISDSVGIYPLINLILSVVIGATTYTLATFLLFRDEWDEYFYKFKEVLK